MEKTEEETKKNQTSRRLNKPTNGEDEYLATVQTNHNTNCQIAKKKKKKKKEKHEEKKRKK